MGKTESFKKKIEKDKRIKACDRKRRYCDQPTALAFADHQMKLGSKKLTTYRCKYCSGWHIAKEANPRFLRREAKVYEQGN